MSYERFAADLTSQPSVRRNTAEESEELLRRLGVSDFELRQLGRGSFRTDVAAIGTSEGIALSHRFERSFHSPIRTPEGMVFLIIPSSARGDLVASGDVVSRGDLIVQTPVTEVDVFAPDLTASESFGVPESRFYALLDSICPGGPSIGPGKMMTVAGDTVQLKRLRRAIIDLVTHPESDPRHEQQANLIAEVIAWMGDADSRWRPEGFLVNGARIRIARLARDYMEDHFPDPIRLEDLCRDIGVSLRTMQRAFAELFQIPPYQYLKKLRLDRARRELLAGEPEAHSVSTIASHNGYSHLSRFAKDYREAFGELPRETLARS